jgi:glyoxylase-like metal-dependent hydrolase (beta-lactamase superfamily II)
LALYPTARFLCHPQCARAAADAKLNYSFAIAGEKYAVTAPAEPLADGAEFSLAGTTWRADFVPGHTADSLCFYLAAASALFSGDTVFAGSIGRDDLDGGDGELLIAGVKRLLGALPPDTRIFSGHGAETTAARELRDNPFLR